MSRNFCRTAESVGLDGYTALLSEEADWHRLWLKHLSFNIFEFQKYSPFCHTLCHTLSHFVQVSHLWQKRETEKKIFFFWFFDSVTKSSVQGHPNNSAAQIFCANSFYLFSRQDDFKKEKTLGSESRLLRLLILQELCNTFECWQRAFKPWETISITVKTHELRCYCSKVSLITSSPHHLPLYEDLKVEQSLIFLNWVAWTWIQNLPHT